MEFVFLGFIIYGIIEFFKWLSSNNVSNIKNDYVFENPNEYYLNTGEAKLHNILKREFCNDSYHLLNNVTLPFDDGTTQIDHVLVSTKGVFVIETKNYSGWIFGKKHDKQWTQVIYEKKSYFQNPIRQNYKHMLAVRKLLDFLPKESVISAIIFVGDAELKNKIENEVFSPLGFVRFVRNQPEIMSKNRLAFSVGRLECTRYQITRKTDIEHVNYLNKKFGQAA